MRIFVKQIQIFDNLIFETLKIIYLLKYIFLAHLLFLFLINLLIVSEMGLTYLCFVIFAFALFHK